MSAYLQDKTPIGGCFANARWARERVSPSIDSAFDIRMAKTLYHISATSLWRTHGTVVNFELHVPLFLNEHHWYHQSIRIRRGPFFLGRVSGISEAKHVRSCTDNLFIASQGRHSHWQYSRPRLIPPKVERQLADEARVL